MSLEDLSKPALEALLAFHADAARRIEEHLRFAEERLTDAECQLRPALPLADPDIETSPEEREDAPLSEQSGALLSPFNLTASRHRSSAPSPSPSPPSTPVSAPRVPSPPSVSVRSWPSWSADITSPTPAPRQSLKRKHDEEEDGDANQRERIRPRIDPGSPRGFIRTPPRRRRLWDKENEKSVL